jgi:hypothetical protein
MTTKKGGRKGKFHEWLEEDGLTKIEAWARDGLTEEQVAKNMGIAYSTLKEWKNKFPTIMAALKKGKEVVDFEVENSLLKRAMGMEVTEEKVYYQEVDGKVTTKKEVVKKQIPPDTTAIIFWLKNRKPYEWRDRRHQVLEGELKVQNDPLEKLSSSELEKLIEALGEDNE